MISVKDLINFSVLETQIFVQVQNYKIKRNGLKEDLLMLMILENPLIKVLICIELCKI
jgi:hypothetical protein